jgi:hypothetical protein
VEGHITDPGNTKMEAVQKTEKNGGVFWGSPGPRRGCSAIDGWNFFISTSRTGLIPEPDESTSCCETQCVFILLYVRMSVSFLNDVCIFIFLINGAWLPHLLSSIFCSPWQHLVQSTIYGSPLWMAFTLFRFLMFCVLYSPTFDYISRCLGRCNDFAD